MGYTNLPQRALPYDILCAGLKKKEQYIINTFHYVPTVEYQMTIAL